jgi:membrane protease YdiL (CAAX protease family)
MGETPETDPLLEALPAEPFPPPEKVERPPPRPERSQRELWLETVVVLCVAVLPTVFNAFAAVIWPATRQARSSMDDSLYFIFFALGPSVLVIYLIHRSGEPVGQFGLVRPLWYGDILGGVGLFLAHLTLWRMMTIRFWPVIEAMENLIPVDAKENTFPVPRGLTEHLFVGLSCAAIGFSEELVTRGYLLPRFERLLGSAWKSIVLTAFLFALWHVYQGMYGFLHAGFLGLLFGVVFWWFRRIWPLAVCHALIDWLAITRTFGS